MSMTVFAVSIVAADSLAPLGAWTSAGLHNFPSGLQTVYHYISAWISDTPLTFMLELVVSL